MKGAIPVVFLAKNNITKWWSDFLYIHFLRLKIIGIQQLSLLTNHCKTHNFKFKRIRNGSKYENEQLGKTNITNSTP